MKFFSSNFRIILMLIAMAHGTSFAFSESALVASYRATFSDLRPPELPTKAAQIVKHEKEDQQKTTTVAVVKAAYAVNPASLLSVVGAIGRGVSAMAPVAAAAAAEAQPRLAWAFARTAALASPEQAGEIVLSVGSVVPEEAQWVATAVALAIPESSTDVITALGTALPQLQPYLAAALAEGTESAPDVIARAAVLNASAPIAVTDPAPEISPPVVGPPVVGPPFVNPPGNPGVIVPGPPFTVPPGWQRKYSRPSGPG